jgi:hypothetical protein
VSDLTDDLKMEWGVSEKLNAWFFTFKTSWVSLRPRGIMKRGSKTWDLQAYRYSRLHGATVVRYTRALRGAHVLPLTFPPLIGQKASAAKSWTKITTLSHRLSTTIYNIKQWLRIYHS